MEPTWNLFNRRQWLNVRSFLWWSLLLARPILLGWCNCRSTLFHLPGSLLNRFRRLLLTLWWLFGCLSFIQFSIRFGKGLLNNWLWLMLFGLRRRDLYMILNRLLRRGRFLRFLTFSRLRYGIGRFDRWNLLLRRIERRCFRLFLFGVLFLDLLWGPWEVLLWFLRIMLFGDGLRSNLGFPFLDLLLPGLLLDLLAFFYSLHL